MSGYCYRTKSNNTHTTLYGSFHDGLYDYLRLLFARVGITYSPVSGRVIKKNDVKEVISACRQDRRAKRGPNLYFKQHTNRNATEELNILLQKGFSRLYINKETVRMGDLLAIPADE